MQTSPEEFTVSIYTNMSVRTLCVLCVVLQLRVPSVLRIHDCNVQESRLSQTDRASASTVNFQFKQL